jgi:acylphosphatase
MIDKEKDEIIEWHLIVRGNVQGVGFRFTVYRIAKEFGIHGTVENLPDGTVEIYAQGTFEPLNLFLAKIQSRFGSDYIHSIKKRHLRAEQKKADFLIL